MTQTKDISDQFSSIDQIEDSERNSNISMDEKLIADLERVIDANIKNEQFSVEDLASEVAMSRSHLHRKLRQLKGVSISQFIRNIRLAKSYVLLESEVGTVSEIAYKVGFGSSTYFIKCFHEAYGFPPGEVKKFKNDEDREGIDESIASDRPPQKNVSTPLESLHPGSSESLILEIFEELIKHKSALGKFLMVDESEGEELDVRLLAYQVIKNYPWPIAVEIRRLFSGGLLEQDQNRLDQLEKTIFRTIKILTYILLSESIRLSNLNIIEFNKKNTSHIKGLWKPLKPMGCKDLLISIHQEVLSNINDVVVAELETVLDKGFFRELDAWIETVTAERNITVEERCIQLEQTLIFFLKKAAFLVRYKMVNVGAIQVKKSRFKEPQFAHEFHLLNSADADFKIHEELLDQFSDSHAVLLMKSVKDPTAFLNLSPFVIDTHQAEHQSVLKAIKRDIFLLDSYKNAKLMFSGSEMVIEDDLSTLPNYEDLVEEYEDVIKLMCGK